MKKIKSYLFSEKRIARVIFGFLAIAALGLVFSPNIYAQFARQTGPSGYGYGNGYGYGYGYGSDGGSNGYRIGGGNLSTYDYGYGYGSLNNLNMVNLGTAGNFVILAKTGISTTGTTSVTGDLGISPAAASYITGFALNLTAGSAYSTSALVTGKVYAPSYASPTPTNLTTAVLDMQAAYTDAASRAPGVTELGAGNIGGLTLTHGIYKWSSNVNIPTDITLSGGANDVWIFQIAGNLTVSSGVHIILSGGAQASNIFWVVAGQTTLGTADTFNGNILDQTAIILQTGAVLNGRALAQTAVTLDANSVTTPSVDSGVTYSWSQSGFATCSVSCGGGTQTQTVTCINSDNSQVVNNSLCSGTAPSTSQSCNTQSCSSGGGGGGGGGGSVINNPQCTNVTYGDFVQSCFDGYEYRSVISRTPNNCALTASQINASRESCTTTTTTTTTTTIVNDNPVTTSYPFDFVASEKALVHNVNMTLSKRLAGRILLQVESQGQAWYVNPLNYLKYYLGRPADAFAIMRQLGLGISEKDYNNFAKRTAPARIAGRIVLRVQAHGEAYYVNPSDRKLYYMGRPADAFALMRRFGLGITNTNLRQIGVGEINN